MAERHPLAIRALRLAIITVVSLIALTGCLRVELTAPTEPVSPNPVENEAATTGHPVEIIRIVDGDTVAIRPDDQFPASNEAGNEHIVRLLSIDTREIANELSGTVAECGALQAQQELERFLNQPVLLLRDPVADPVDRYGRTLAYLETLEGLDLSAEQVRAGWAEPYFPASEPEPSRFQMYLPLAEQAESQRVGVWQLCP